MDKVAQIRALNDAFRTKLVGGRLMLTRGIAGRPDANEILARVSQFNEFNEENDPHHEHDFGSIDQNGERIFWKIDYYDRELQAGSPDPADPTVTERVITILLASEY